MSRRYDFEEQLLDKIQEIVDMYKEYNPAGEYLSMTYSIIDGIKYFSVQNQCWHGGADQDCVIDATRKTEVQK